jgi:hypothetical protein
MSYTTIMNTSTNASSSASPNTLFNIISEYIELRSKIKNNHNGYSKLGCVAFSPKLKHQRVLRVWI